MKSTLKKTGMIILAAALLLPAAVTTGRAAEAQEEKPTASLAVAALSQYVWRGWAYSRDSIVIQPSATISYKGVSANVWSNMDSDPYSAAGSNKSNLNETDLTLSYAGNAGIMGYNLGYIYYGLDGLDDSQELYAGVNLDVPGKPTLTVYKEITALGGWYASLGLSHSVKLTETIGLDLGASAGYYDDGRSYNELHNGLLTATLNLPAGKYLTVSPQLAYSFGLSSAAKTRLKADNLGLIGKNESNFLYGGVSVALAF